MLISSPRISGWSIALRSSMEQPNKEGCSPGRNPEGPECSGTAEGQESSPLRRSHAGLEHNLRRILLRSNSGSEKSPPSSDPKLPALPLPLILSDLGQPRKLPLTNTDKKYPVMKQRGFYSDILSPGTLDQLGVSVAAIPYQP